MDFAELGRRLKAARERVGLTQQVAADAVGVNRVVLSYFETGARQPSLVTLSALARLYGLTVAQLVADQEPERTDLAEMLFRDSGTALADSAQASVQSLDAILRGYLDALDLLAFPIPGLGVSPIGGSEEDSRREAPGLARQVREIYGLGEGPVGDHLFNILDKHLLVFRLALGDDLRAAPSGLFLNHPKAGFVVVVNSDMTAGRQVFTLAHELGHALFHSQTANLVVSVPSDRSRREKFADTFSGELLVPSDALSRTLRDLGSLGSASDPAIVVHLQRHFGVSYGTMLMRLRQAKLITPASYRELGSVSPSRLAEALGYDVPPADLGDYSMPTLERFPERVLWAVRSAVLQGFMTRGDAAETLGVSVEDVLRLLDRPSATARETRELHELEQVAGFR